ncbi:alpha-ketoglutarate-dependent dioxygenase AlkB [Ferrimonas lipolytica]|uniref:Alpha-ketoglutarate-dependent dioxygenase AlkB n=1 Tax=Ferrimonas lipolytica TaxID=2724191 RepID=A0A6H1UI60_9GAMM|nr:alpha-ketoglutarate-dependent dioxygenase AlkB [Ferrimonas lipolytica]QIZ78771.1 alpha-ketoglutarate-dependent dioxygenase AlkB [Ferrimonas lipolytica]
MTMQEQRLFDDSGRLLASYWKNWLPVAQQRQLWPQLQQLPWQQPLLQMFGKRHRIPRQQCYLGQPGCAYRYSGMLLEPEPFDETLTQLTHRLNDFGGWRFNAVLANHYRDGNDKMGWHRDNEPELGSTPDLAIVSLGQSRSLRLRWQIGPSKGITLTAGSLLWLPAGVYHSLGSSTAQQARISLTFRQVIPHYHRR